MLGMNRDKTRALYCRAQRYLKIIVSFKPPHRMRSWISEPSTTNFRCTILIAAILIYSERKVARPRAYETWRRIDKIAAALDKCMNTT